MKLFLLFGAWCVLVLGCWAAVLTGAMLLEGVSCLARFLVRLTSRPPAP